MTAEEIDKLFIEEFSSIGDKFSSLEHDYNVGMLDDCEIIRYWGILERLRKADDDVLDEYFNKVKVFVDSLVSVMADERIDAVIKQFDDKRWVGALDYALENPGHVKNLKSLLSYIDCVDSAIILKSQREMKKPDGENQIVPNWVSKAWAVRQFCNDLLQENLNVIKPIFPYISTMAALTDAEYRGSVYTFFSCALIKCGEDMGEPTNETDKWFKEVYTHIDTSSE